MRLLCIVALLAATASAQSLPAKPEPVLTPAGRAALAPLREAGSALKGVVTFKDPQYAAAAWGMTFAYAADMWTTSACYGASITCRERGIFFNGTRDTYKVALAWAGADIAMLTVTHVIRTRVKNKWVRRASLAIPLHRMYLHGEAAYYNDLRTTRCCGPAGF